MPAFQLETIDPQARSTARADTQAELLETVRVEAYSKGFKEGVSVASSGLEAERNTHLATIAELLNDQRFDFERANAAVLISVLRLVDAVARAISADLVEVHFEEIVLRKVREVLLEAEAGDLVIAVSPDRYETLRRSLDDLSDQLPLEADADLSGHVAELRWANGADRIDLDRVLADISAALAEYREQQKGAFHERRQRA